MPNIAKLPNVETPSGYVAAEVRAQLARRGWSGTRLALALGVTQASISRRLTGDVPFDVDDLVRISEALGVHPGTFFPGGHDDSPSNNGLQLSETEQRMILAMRSSMSGPEKDKGQPSD